MKTRKHVERTLKKGLILSLLCLAGVSPSAFAQQSEGSGFSVQFTPEP